MKQKLAKAVLPAYYITVMCLFLGGSFWLALLVSVICVLHLVAALVYGTVEALLYIIVYMENELADHGITIDWEGKATPLLLKMMRGDR
jgi:hypothetical protein